MSLENSYNDIVAVWKTNNRVTEFFLENLPTELWAEKVPGAPQRTIRMIAGHIHNTRCMWIKLIGKHYNIRVPAGVDRRRVTRSVLLRALRTSDNAIIQLLNVGLRNGGMFRTPVPWNNIPSDVFHFVAYLCAHEAHHRGQIVLVARAVGRRLPPEITTGLWQWKRRDYEANNQGGA